MGYFHTIREGITQDDQVYENITGPSTSIAAINTQDNLAYSKANQTINSSYTNYKMTYQCTLFYHVKELLFTQNH